MIQIKNLAFSYTGKAPYLLEDLNLQIPKGAYVSILGENGSSKTTLIKLILGVLSPVKGTISLSTKKVGYVPQKFEGFNSQFPLTVNELLKIHMKVIKLSDNNIIDDSLSLINMNSYKNSLIGNLSGGQQQKVFITRALMGNPELLVLDELSTGVDINSQSEIYSIIKDLNVNKNITVVAVEHNLNAALKNSTHILDLSGDTRLLTIDEYISRFNNDNVFNIRKVD
ncbi:metal ABC transporter ATP-binding protein [Clostridium polynesiense]|uniref:metal ABC transporter ATP-binding protein n=1 Tax=Clostridium polynesiense TaxID=1325933 RepID=UPI00058E3AE4|nr:metal ABC transporter ATP-binding protein [Clostridium polynesiense]